MTIQLKRAYDDPQKNDGYRVLVDGMWPRGIAKEDAKLDDWLKDIAPSKELRQWFDHDPKRWAEFRRRYLAELKEHREPLRDLAERAKQGTVTLVYATKDEKHNNALVVEQYLKMLGAD
ncbi:DUF488 domain-containing protein [Pistricoccus aurantiacus]|uniref:DUF488 domain-containing protein n=1 Tax=Pistricoccus aurantiacus TaxID=1883414 RepID=UPI0036347EEB